MTITLRKKSPFTCRAAGHHSFPLTDSDGSLCPEHEAARRLGVAKADLPIPDAIPAPSSRFMSDADWAERVTRGPIWPTAEAA